MYCLIIPWKIVLNNHYVIIIWWHGINDFDSHFINDWLVNVFQKSHHALNLHNVISHLVSFHYVVVKEF